MSKYMDNNAKVGLDGNSAAMYCENPNQEPNMVESPKVSAPVLAGGTNPNGPSHSEISYMDDNSQPVSENAADSRAKNRNTIVEVSSADATPNDPKNFSVDDFLHVSYSSGSNPGNPNMSGLYGGKK